MVQFEINEFFDIQSIEKTAQLYEKLIEDRFYVSNTGISYRTINHWNEKGLIRCNRKNEGGDRRFSFADFVWIKIVNELRSFGVSIPTIKKITDEIYTHLPIQAIFENINSNLESVKNLCGQDNGQFLEFLKNKDYENADFTDIKITYLHILIADTISGREPMSIIVIKGGEWFPFNPNKENIYSEEVINKRKFSSHISICLLDIIFQFFKSETVIRFMKDFKLISSLEQKMLDELESDSFNKVSVFYKTEKYTPLEIKKSKTAKSQLLQIIRDRQYSHFIITDVIGNENKLMEE
jgi:DNA-binding transcriptional MerR regulator